MAKVVLFYGFCEPIARLEHLLDNYNKVKLEFLENHPADEWGFDYFLENRDRNIPKISKQTGTAELKKKLKVFANDIRAAYGIKISVVKDSEQGEDACICLEPQIIMTNGPPALEIIKTSSKDEDNALATAMSLLGSIGNGFTHYCLCGIADSSEFCDGPK